MACIECGWTLQHRPSCVTRQWPALVAKVRAQALQEVQELLESLLSAEPAGDVDAPLMLIKTGNAQLRRAISAVQDLAQQPPKESR